MTLADDLDLERTLRPGDHCGPPVPAIDLLGTDPRREQLQCRISVGFGLSGGHEGAADELQGICDTTRQCRTNVVAAAHEAVLVIDAVVEELAMQGFGTVLEMKPVLV